tara:strand:- start:2512 stop:4830 length:2319 start_codon:yes stop_codon:yes gene_type:complete
MVNVNFTIDEVAGTLTVEPLHEWKSGGRGYMYIWGPKQRMNRGFMANLHRITGTGVTGWHHQKPKYLIRVDNDTPHTISIDPCDMDGNPGANNSNCGTNPIYLTNPVNNQTAVPSEFFPNHATRGLHGWDSVERFGWNFVYRFEWEEPGPGGGHFVDTIASERGIGVADKYMSVYGWGNPTGNCNGYNTPILRTEILNNSEQIFISDITDYTATCGGESQHDHHDYDGVFPYRDGVVGDEWRQGIRIARIADDKNGVAQHYDKDTLFYPPKDANHYFPSLQVLSWEMQAQGNGQNTGFHFPSVPVPDSAGAAFNKHFWNWAPERQNLSQVSPLSNAYTRIPKINNPHGLEFIDYEHRLRQYYTDPTPAPIPPTPWVYEYILNNQTNVYGRPTGHVREPNLPFNPAASPFFGLTAQQGYMIDLTDLEGMAIPDPNQPNRPPAPPGGEFVSHIKGVIRKSMTMEVCGTPQVDYGNLNERNNLFDGWIGSGPYAQWFQPHVHGQGGTSFNRAGDGGRGSIVRFASHCRKSWSGDALRNASLQQGGSPIQTAQNQPDITHMGSTPRWDGLPAERYLGHDSWKWPLAWYDSNGLINASFDTDGNNNYIGNHQMEAWPTRGRNMRNWIGNSVFASSPYFMQGVGRPMPWSTNNVNYHTGKLFAIQLPGPGMGNLTLYNWDWRGGGTPFNHFTLPSIKELDSPSYFNFITGFDEEVRIGNFGGTEINKYGTGGTVHQQGYNCILDQSGNPTCAPAPVGTAGNFNNFSDCHAQCAFGNTI